MAFPLLSFYTFVYYVTPDSLFLVVLFELLLHLALFTGCIVAGGWLLYRGDRGIGLGLLIGGPKESSGSWWA